MLVQADAPAQPLLSWQRSIRSVLSGFRVHLAELHWSGSSGLLLACSFVSLSGCLVGALGIVASGYMVVTIWMLPSLANKCHSWCGICCERDAMLVWVGTKNICNAFAGGDRAGTRRLPSTYLPAVCRGIGILRSCIARAVKEK